MSHLESFDTWIVSTIQNPMLTDLLINGDRGVYSDHGMGLIPLDYNESEFTEPCIRQWVVQKLSEAGKSWDAKSPFTDFIWSPLPGIRCRIQVTFPPVSSQGCLVSLRRLSVKPLGPNLGFDSKWNPSPHFRFLQARIQAGDSMVVCGATGSGKTTLVNDLIHFIPHHERIISLEDTQELNPVHPHFIALTSRMANSDSFGEVTLRQLLKQTLRMRPDRIVLGECRGVEVLDFLQALNTGHKGALATLHANSDRDALKRIELMCLLASNGSIPVHVIRELIALGLQWIVFVKKTAGQRFIHSISKVEGREGDVILLRPQTI